MVRDGQLLCSRKGAFGLINKMDLIKGRVQGHPDGFGFLIPEQGGKDFVLTHRQMRCCFDGDIVLARKGERDHRGRIEAIIVEVLEQNTQELVGLILEDVLVAPFVTYSWVILFLEPKANLFRAPVLV